MDKKGFEKKPWFPYVKNMYEEIGENMMDVNAKGYEEKPWWPYVLDLQEKIDAGGGGGSSDFSTAEVTVTMPTPNLQFIGHQAVGVNEGLVIVSSPMGDMLITNIGSEAETPKVWSVVLFQGYAGFELSDDAASYTVTTSGDVTYEDGHLSITGSGSVTVARK